MVTLIRLTQAIQFNVGITGFTQYFLEYLTKLVEILERRWLIRIYALISETFRKGVLRQVLLECHVVCVCVVWERECVFATRVSKKYHISLPFIILTSLNFFISRKWKSLLLYLKIYFQDWAVEPLNRWVNLANYPRNILTPSKKGQKEHIPNQWKSAEKRGTFSWRCCTGICTLSICFCTMKKPAHKMKTGVVFCKRDLSFLFFFARMFVKKTLLAKKQGTWQRQPQTPSQQDVIFDKKTNRFFKSNLLSAQNFYHGKQLLEQFVRLTHRKTTPWAISEINPNPNSWD